MKTFEKTLLKGCNPDLIAYIAEKLSDVAGSISDVCHLLNKEHGEAAGELASRVVLRQAHLLQKLKDMENHLTGNSSDSGTPCPPTALRDTSRAETEQAPLQDSNDESQPVSEPKAEEDGSPLDIEATKTSPELV